MNDNTLKSGALLKHGEYRIIRVLGQGGFGITYEAEQVSLRRKVAVKEFFMKDSCERDESTSHVTVPTASNRELVSRFKDKFIREARMIAGLDHEHIVKIYDVFEENGTAYYVMEYLGGGCLGDVVKAGIVLPEQEAFGYIRQIASALSYLHKKGIIHFDVKPSNVLKTEDGKLKLIDFGISKHYDESGVQTSSTPVGISKGYAPLEQYQQGSDIKSFTPATDIYSLGATLYALLAGSNLPEASVVNEDGVPSIEGVSPSVKCTIEKAMQPRRKDRPQSVDEFLNLLDGKSKDDEETVVPSNPKESVYESRSKEMSPAKAEQVPSEKKKRGNPLAKYGWIVGVAIAAILSVVLFLNRGGQTEIADSMMIDGMAECIIEFGSTAAEREFKIEKNFKEKWTYTRVPEWCSVKAEEGKIVLSITENKTKEARTATVEFRKKDGAEVLAKLTINQTSKGTKGQQQVEEKVYGSVKISSTPSGASIWIDGKDTKKTTPEIIEDLIVGSHKVVLKLSGYEDASGRTTIRENERAELALTLISSHSNNGHEWVDLGLSVKWATCNVGATKPEEYGEYFAWAETSSKRSGNVLNLKYFAEGDYIDTGKYSKYVADSKHGMIDNLTTLELSDDAAHANWGGRWRMPTEAEWKELRQNCTWTFISNYKGTDIAGLIITSNKPGYSEESIFLPAAGYQHYDSTFEKRGTYCWYWGASLDQSDSSRAFFMDSHSGGVGMYYNYRSSCFSVRPVCP